MSQLRRLRTRLPSSHIRKPEPLPEPNRKALQPGDGVKVDAVGRALLYLSDLLILEVVREGDLVVRQAPAEDQPVLVVMALSAGTILNNFSAEDEWKRWLARGDQQVTFVVESPIAKTTINFSPPTLIESVQGQLSAPTPSPTVSTTPSAAPSLTPSEALTGTLVETPIQATGQPTQPVPAAGPGMAATAPSQGTGWTISQETYTPLQWDLVQSEGISVEVVTAENKAVVEYGMAHWIAPDGVIGPSVPYKRDAVANWSAQIKNGETTKEIGDVLWDPADIDVDTGGIETLPAPGVPFMYAGVEVTLDPTGLDGAPAYSLDDCNGDGITDIVMRNGKLQLNFRPLLNRVRAADLELFGAKGHRSAYALNPAREVIRQEGVTLTEGAYELLSLRSDLRKFEQPYHFAVLEAEDSCFLGFSLTPPEPDDVPGKPRWPVLPGEMKPTLPDIAATPTPPCEVECPAGWAMYRVHADDTLWAIAERTRYFSTGLTIDELKQVNCIPPESDIVRLDSFICVPAPPTPPPQPTPQVTEESSTPDNGCPKLVVTAHYVYSPTVQDAALKAYSVPISDTYTSPLDS